MMTLLKAPFTSCGLLWPRIPFHVDCHVKTPSTIRRWRFCLLSSIPFLVVVLVDCRRRLNNDPSNRSVYVLFFSRKRRLSLKTSLFTSRFTSRLHSGRRLREKPQNIGKRSCSHLWKRLCSRLWKSLRLHPQRRYWKTSCPTGLGLGCLHIESLLGTEFLVRTENTVTLRNGIACGNGIFCRNGNRRQLRLYWKTQWKQRYIVVYVHVSLHVFTRLPWKSPSLSTSMFTSTFTSLSPSLCLHVSLHVYVHVFLCTSTSNVSENVFYGKRHRLHCGSCLVYVYLHITSTPTLTRL